MARTKTSVLTMFFIVSFLVLTQELEATRPSPPSTVRTIQTKPSHDAPIVQIPPSMTLKVIRPPLTSIGFKMGRYKKFETEAFRPTAPGRSPGAGHEEPPGSHQ